jgi:hypothetical protein
VGSTIRRVLRKLRGILGLGVAGGAMGLVGGVLVGLTFGGIGTAAPLWALFGAATGVGFGVVLGITDTFRSLDQLRAWHGALLGGGVGAFVAALWPVYGGSFVTTAAVLGALFTSSMVAMAKRADRLEIGAGDGGGPAMIAETE